MNAPSLRLTTGRASSVSNKVRTVALTLVLASMICFASPAPARALSDDRAVSIRSATDVAAKRQALIRFIWGSAGFPSTKLPSSVKLKIPSPVNKLGNLQRVDELRIKMDRPEAGESLAYHFIPAARKNNRLVILHHGHACTFNDSSALADEGYGMQRTINALLHDGYAVLAMYMPHMRPDDCTDKHNDMFNLTTSGSPMKFFLEPIAVGLNYLKAKYSSDTFPRYTEFNMAGLSGGGWTTTVYAAIDPSITFSFPVAGTIPLYLRSGGSIGDKEQYLDAFYQIAGYPDLYVLGSYGAGRKQVQILNRRDECCFGEAQHDAASTGASYDAAMREYEARVRQVLFTLGLGTFRLEIDEAAPGHMISHNTIFNVMLSELNHGRRYIGASSGTDAFVRGMNGHLWHHGPGGWEDTGFAMVGVPAVLRGIVNGDVRNDFDVFFRDPSNRLKRAWKSSSSGWVLQDMNGVVISDPAAASWSANRFDVVALGGDYRLYHWWWNGGNIELEQVSGTAMGLGTPALVAQRANRLDIVFRGWDRAVHRLRSSGSAPWTLDKPGGTILDFPSAVATGGNTLRVYVRGQSNQLWEAWQTNGGAWQWASLSATTGSTGTLVSGSPSASAQGDGVKVYVRSSTGKLTSFTLAGGTWGFANHAGSVTGSPTSTPYGALARGNSAGLWLFDGTQWISQGGVFD